LRIVDAMAKPVPLPDELSSGFWEAAARRELVVQQCGNCGWFAYPPGLACVNCHIDPPDFDWETVSGAGRLKTWTVMRDSFLPGFAGDVPYVVADVELAEQPGLRMVARLDGVEPEDLELGLALRVDYGDIGGGRLVPYFVLATS
jgi:uncharacterized OB-fold protein